MTGMVGGQKARNASVCRAVRLPVFTEGTGEAMQREKTGKGRKRDKKIMVSGPMEPTLQHRLLSRGYSSAER